MLEKASSKVTRLITNMVWSQGFSDWKLSLSLHCFRRGFTGSSAMLAIVDRVLETGDPKLPVMPLTELGTSDEGPGFKRPVCWRPYISNTSLPKAFDFDVTPGQSLAETILAHSQTLQLENLVYSAFR